MDTVRLFKSDSRLLVVHGFCGHVFEPGDFGGSRGLTYLAASEFAAKISEGKDYETSMISEGDMDGQIALTTNPLARAKQRLAETLGMDLDKSVGTTASSVAEVADNGTGPTRVFYEVQPGFQGMFHVHRCEETAPTFAENFARFDGPNAQSHAEQFSTMMTAGAVDNLTRRVREAEANYAAAKDSYNRTAKRASELANENAGFRERIAEMTAQVEAGLLMRKAANAFTRLFPSDE